MKRYYFNLIPLFAFICLFFIAPLNAIDNVVTNSLSEIQDSIAERKAFDIHIKRINEVPDSLLTCKEKVEKYELALLCYDNFYIDENGLQRTKLTVQDFLDRGYSRYYYDEVIRGLNENNKGLKKFLENTKQISKTGTPKIEKDMSYFEEARPLILKELEKAKKELAESIKKE